MSFCYVAALVVPRPFRPSYPKPLVSVRVALFLGNICAQTHLATKSNHCILIARYFVSRCPLFYVLYYLARLDSGCVSGNQCTFVLYYGLIPPSLSLYRSTVVEYGHRVSPWFQNLLHASSYTR